MLAAEVAKELQCPLEPLVVRKVGAPDNPEYGIGAVGPGGVRVHDPTALARLRISEAEFSALADVETRELERRLAQFGSPCVPGDLTGRTAILIDDGLATGITALAACRFVRSLQPAEVIFAAPVGSASGRALVSTEADEVICISTPDPFYSVGQFYADFTQVAEDTLLPLLGRHTGRLVRFSAGDVWLEADLVTPPNPRGVVLFAHGSGSGRSSPRNLSVARELQRAGFATLLVDVLTPEETEDPAMTFDVGLLADRLAAAVRFLEEEPETGTLPIGLFGASTGAAAALATAIRFPTRVKAVVSRGGRTDLAGDSVSSVVAPTLLLIGENDRVCRSVNSHTMGSLSGKKELVVIPNAGHLFEEPGAMEEVARQSVRWFTTYLTPRSA